MIIRPIAPQEFDQFLEQLPEWSPINWPTAPQAYVQLIDSKSYHQIEDLQTLPSSVLPMMVRQAFIGWKNYFMEGPQINDLEPTFAQMKEFLDKHSHYARNYWRNIEESQTPRYLKSPLKPIDSIVAVDEISAFLRVALYNFIMSQKEGMHPAPK